jgi:hypothetical protein
MLVDPAVVREVSHEAFLRFIYSLVRYLLKKGESL